MQRVYTLLIHSYGIMMRTASKLHPKAKKWQDGRLHWQEKLRKDLDTNALPVIWFHAASLGEFEQGRPVLEAIKAKLDALGQPHKVLLTFFSPSGYEVRKDYPKADFVHYLPLDTPQNARLFLDIVKPVAAFFIKYEFWVNFISEIQKRKIKLILFSALFREEQLFFKPYGALFRNLLKGYTQIFVQNEASLAALKPLGLGNVSQAGDTRFDRVSANAEGTYHNATVAQFKAGQPLLVVGSCWGKDLDLLLPFLQSLDVPLRTLIAPHEIHESTLKRIEKALPSKVLRYSQARQVIGNDLDQYSVLLIDNVGLLAKIYRYADFAYVGGAFGEGLHNILEPTAFGVPVLFGKNYSKFPEAKELIQAGGAFSLTDSSQLILCFDRLYHNEAMRDKIREINQNYIQKNAHSTQKIVDYFFEYVYKAL